MTKTKLLASIFVIAAVLFATAGIALAATPITGTVQSIAAETDENGVTTMLVTLTDDQGESQTVRISVETAAALGLVALNADTGEVTIDEAKVGQPVEIDPTTVIPQEEPGEEPVHPIAAILASYFGVDPAVVDAYHEDGFGFGVIAQAMWIAQGMSGDMTTAGLILEAKASGDYSAFTLPDGSTPANWGQFKKAALGKEKKNLGIIVSGQADRANGQDSLSQQENENGKGNEKGKGAGKDKNPGKGKGKNKNP